MIYFNMLFHKILNFIKECSSVYKEIYKTSYTYILLNLLFVNLFICYFIKSWIVKLYFLLFLLIFILFLILLLKYLKSNKLLSLYTKTNLLFLTSQCYFYFLLSCLFLFLLDNLYILPEFLMSILNYYCILHPIYFMSLLFFIFLILAYQVDKEFI